jgi:hypothetical protein
MDGNEKGWKHEARSTTGEKNGFCVFSSLPSSLAFFFFPFGLKILFPLVLSVSPEWLEDAGWAALTADNPAQTLGEADHYSVCAVGRGLGVFRELPPYRAL